MGLDLTKLNEIVKVADQAGNKDGKVNVEDKKEVSVFEAELAKLGLTKEEEQDIYKSMGLEKTPASRKERRAAKKVAEGKEDIALDKLTNLVNDGVEPAKIVTELQKTFGTQAKDAKYQQIANEVGYVLSLVPTYGSKDDVEKIHDKVKKDLKAAKKWDSFHKDILEQLERQAEATQRTKEYNEIKQSFQKKYNENTNLEKVMDEIKAEFKDKGSYYKEILSNGKFGNRLARALTFRGKKLSEFEKSYVMPQAREIVRDSVNDAPFEKSKEVKGYAEYALEQDGDYDKYTKRALGGENTFSEWVQGKDSDMKVARKNQARFNRVEKAKNQTEAEVLDALGKNGNKLLEALTTSGLITKKADGNYDLTVLFDVIVNEVGSDRYLDKHDNKAISEKLGTYSRIKRDLGLEDTLRNKQAKKLVKLCGIDIEGANWGKIAWNTTLGGLFGALSAGGAEAARGNSAHQYKKHDQIQSSIHLDTDDLNNIGFKTIVNGKEIPNPDKPILNITFPEGAESAARVVVDLTTNIDNMKDLLLKGGKFVLSNALKGALIGAALGFLSGLADTSKKEVSIAEINFDCTKLEDYIKDVELKFPKWSGALTQIAMTFVDDKGNWDCDGFKDFLRKAAGNDILNRKELIAALQDKQKELESTATPVTTPTTTPTTTPVGGEQQTTLTTTPEKCPVDMDETVGKKAVVHDIKFGDSWEELVEAYFPTWKECFGKLQGKDGAVRALKKALATKADGTLDNAMYQKLLAGYIPSSISVPEQIGDCKRDGDTIKDLNFRQPIGEAVGYMGSVGIQTNTNGEVTLTDCKGRSGKGKNIEEAVIELNKKLEAGETPYTESDIVK